MDAETLAQLLVDEELCQDVQITAATCDQCLNTDADRFVIVDVDPLVLRVRCMECSSVSDISLKDWARDESGNGDDAQMTEDLKHMKDSNRNDDETPWRDGGDRLKVGSQDCHNDGKYRDGGTGQDHLPFSCRCGNNEVANWWRGDHIAWKRLPGYDHHAIINYVSDDVCEFVETSHVVPSAKLGGLTCTAVVNVAMEAALFTDDAFFRDEVRRRLSKLGSERAGNLIGGSDMGIVGQLLVPVPILGDLVGCTLGSLIRRYVAALTNKRLAAIKHHSRLSTDNRPSERRAPSPSSCVIGGRKVCGTLHTTHYSNDKH